MDNFMFSLTKGEIYAIINLLKEIIEGSETTDLLDDALELLEMLEAIIDA